MQSAWLFANVTQSTVNTCLELVPIYRCPFPVRSAVRFTSFPSSSWRSFHLLQTLSWALFSGDQGYYGVSGPPEAQLIYTLSKCHCLLHEPYLTNHHSSQEHAIYGTSCLLLAFLNLTTCHLSNKSSINLI